MTRDDARAVIEQAGFARVLDAQWHDRRGTCAYCDQPDAPLLDERRKPGVAYCSACWHWFAEQARAAYPDLQQAEHRAAQATLFDV
jgi:hypothetical protein